MSALFPTISTHSCAHAKHDASQGEQQEKHALDGFIDDR